MKKVLGVVFALSLFLLPVAWGVRAEDTQISADQGQTSADLRASGPFSFFRNFILKHFTEKKEEADLDKANVDAAKSRLSGFQKRVEDILKRLNNTSE